MEKTLFVIGNGPSLKEIMENPDYLNLIKQNDSFCLNNFYKAMEKYDFYPTYFGCFDYVVNESNKLPFENLVRNNSKIQEFYFIGNGNNKQKMYDDDVYNNSNFIKFNFLDESIYKYKGISKSFNSFNNAGASGANALQIGIMKGYKKIVLLGCDCNYIEQVDCATKNNKGKLVVKGTPTHNPNYWFPEYHSNGDTYNFPQTQVFQMQGWKNIYDNCPSDVEIINCSMISQIPFFEKKPFSNI